MKYSKCRPKLIASGVLDALSSLAYVALAVLFIIVGFALTGEDGTSQTGSEIAEAISAAFVGVLAIVFGIICLGAFLFSLVGTVITLKSINLDVSGLKKFLTQLKVAAGFNYAAVAIFVIGAIYDFTQCEGDSALIGGACALLAIAAFRAVSGVLKSSAIKTIKSEPVEEESESFFSQNENHEN